MYDAANPRWTEAIEAGESSAPTGVLFDALSAPRRRIALGILAERGASDLESLAESVACADAEDGDVDEEDLRNVRTRLHHVHLPKLDDAALVEYDPEARRAVPTTDDLDLERVATSAVGG